MPLKPSKFKLDEQIRFAGNPLTVAGIVQFEDAAGQLVTRYLLGSGAGALQILEERGEATFTVLRPFPPAAQPQVEGSQMMVMGEKYTLANVSKLKLVDAEGKTPTGTPAPPLLLSGRFESGLGVLLREIVPGPNTQTFYSLKPVAASDLLTAEQAAAADELAARFREEQALAASEAEEEGGWAKKIGGWVITALIVGTLAYSCSGSDSDDSSSGSARSTSVHSGGSFHGK